MLRVEELHRCDIGEDDHGQGPQNFPQLPSVKWLIKFLPKLDVESENLVADDGLIVVAAQVAAARKVIVRFFRNGTVAAQIIFLKLLPRICTVQKNEVLNRGLVGVADLLAKSPEEQPFIVARKREFYLAPKGVECEIAAQSLCEVSKPRTIFENQLIPLGFTP